MQCEPQKLVFFNGVLTNSSLSGARGVDPLGGCEHNGDRTYTHERARCAHTHTKGLTDGQEGRCFAGTKTKTKKGTKNESRFANGVFETKKETGRHTEIFERVLEGSKNSDKMHRGVQDVPLFLKGFRPLFKK